MGLLVPFAEPLPIIELEAFDLAVPFILLTIYDKFEDGGLNWDYVYDGTLLALLALFNPKLGLGSI